MTEVNFESLNLPIPDIVKTYPDEKKREIFNYLNDMSDLEKVGYKIAFNHLESSFDIYICNLFHEARLNIFIITFFMRAFFMRAFIFASILFTSILFASILISSYFWTNYRKILKYFGCST